MTRRYIYAWQVTVAAALPVLDECMYECLHVCAGSIAATAPFSKGKLWLATPKLSKHTMGAGNERKMRHRKRTPFLPSMKSAHRRGGDAPLGTAYWPHRLGSALRKLPPRSPVPLRMQLLRYNRFLPPSVTSIHRCNTLRMYCPNACHDEMQH